MGGLNTERARLLERLQAQDWDLVVVGGGISGAGVAQQAAAQGWRVLLVEQRDFAWGTSSRSSKLVHGGLRYLAQGDIATTWHSVHERQRLRQEAPALVRPQVFLQPLRPGSRPGRWPMQLGLALYDRMAGSRSHRYADRAETLRLAPGLASADLQGALLFHDAQTDDARLVLRVLQAAQTAGATALNDLAATGLQRQQGRVCGLELQDRHSGQRYAVRARCVVNATGAWADRLRAQVDGAPMVRPLRGSHLILPFWRLPLACSISLMHPQDGRPVFFYPWEGVILVGTTDLDHPSALDDEAAITSAEVDYLLAAIHSQFPAAAIQAADIQACYAGVRPVVDAGQTQASQAPREHVVCSEAGLITLAGGKLTTFRLMAQDALALAAPLVGKPFARSSAPVLAPASALPGHWSAALRQRLQARYGAAAARLCAGAAPELLEPVPGSDTLWLELQIAARHEAVQQLDDLLLRRTRLGLLLPQGAQALLPQIRSLCAPWLGWNAERWQQEEASYRQRITQHYQLPQGKLGKLGGQFGVRFQLI